MNDRAPDPSLACLADQPAQTGSPSRLDRTRGVAAIWLVLMLGMFMGFAAMAVDLGNWYIVRTQVQNATDAAALAGAALLPDDPVNAVAEAERVAVQHGYDVADVDVTLAGGSQLEVHISTEVDNVFLPAIGFANSRDIGGNAIAEYEGSVAMGSPDSQLGNDPELLGTSFVQDDLTLGIEAPFETKSNGDRYHTSICGSTSHSFCDASANNEEYDEDGYFFTIKVEATHGEDLVVDIFDAIYAEVGQSCNYYGFNYEGWDPYYGDVYMSYYGLPSFDERTFLRDMTSGGDYTYDGRSVPEDYYEDALDRYYPYESGDQAYWCLGDGLSGVTTYGGNTVRLETSFIMREPDNTPWNHLDNPVIDTVDCPMTTFAGYRFNSAYDNRAMDLLSPPDGDFDDEGDFGGDGTIDDEGEWYVDPDDGVWTFAETFRRWARFCVIPSIDVEVGEYVLQVRTNADTSDQSQADASLYSEGANMFSLRAGFDTASGLDDKNDVKLSAAGRLPINVNLDAGSPEFFLARVLPTARERTLTVELFDAGDTNGAAGWIQVQPPDDPSSPANFTGCVFNIDGGASISYDSNTCTLQNVTNSTYNGKVVIIDIPIPESYDCDEASEDGCWVKLRMQFSDAHDFTTWSAYISGDPVRLIE